MCERHSRELDHYCLQHDQLVCSVCAVEDHSQTPCDNFHLQEAVDRLQPRLESETEELKRLQKQAKDILDGRRQKDVTRILTTAEENLENFYNRMKQKIDRAKRKARPFTETALSRAVATKLKGVTTNARKSSSSSTSKKKGDDDDAAEIITKFKETKERVTKATEVLKSLPNYIEIEENNEFSDVVTFNGDPLSVTSLGDVEDGVDDEEMDFSADSKRLHLREKSTFYIEHCSDVVIFDDYVIASVRDTIQKRDKHKLEYRQGLSMEGATTLSQLGETRVAVMQRHLKSISVLDTMPKIAVMYKISMPINYFDMSHVENIEPLPLCPDPLPVFVVCYSKRETFIVDYVDLLRPKKTQYPGRPPSTYASQSTNVLTSAAGKNKNLFRGVKCVGAANGNILIGAAKAVSCVSQGGTLIWTVPTDHAVTSMQSLGTIVGVAIQDEQRMLTVGKTGEVIQDNILPSNGTRPESIGMSREIMLIKDFGTWNWFLYHIAGNH